MPVYEGEWLGSGWSPTNRVGSEEIALVAQAQNVPGDNSFWPIRYDVLKAPPGWVIAGSYTSTPGGHTVPANSSWCVPPGVYLAGVDLRMQTDVGTGKTVGCFFDWGVDPGQDVPYGGTGQFYDPVFGTPNYMAGGLGLASRTMPNMGFYRQSVAMYEAGVSVFLMLFQDSGSPITLLGADQFVVRIA